MGSGCRASQSLWINLSSLCGFRGVLLVFAVCTWSACSLTQQSASPQPQVGMVMDYTPKKDTGPGADEIKEFSMEEDAPDPSLPEQDQLSLAEHVELGDQSRKQGNIPLALSHYQKALALEPTQTNVQQKIGDLFLDSNKPQDAITYYSRILEQQPDYASAYEGLGQAYLQLDQVQEAEVHLNKALDLNPDLWKAHAFLGIIYDQQGNYSRSVPEHQKALDLNPDNSELYNNLGVAYFLMGRTDEAIPYFQRALQKGPVESQIYNNLGVALSKARKFPEAFIALQQGENDARGYNNVGVLMLKAGYAQQAIPCFERALDVQPNFYFKAHNNLKYARKVLRQQLEQGAIAHESLPSPCAPDF